MVPRGINHLRVAASAFAALALVVLALAPVAGAQPAPRSDHDAQIAEAVRHFERGRTLMKDKKYAEACDAFAESQKLDPGWGTLYNLARCRELDGKLASALALFRELARPDTYPAQPGEVTPDRDRARRKDASVRATALEKRVPKLRLTAPDAPAGLTVTLDGADVTSRVGTDHPVDLGAHQIHATATARKPFDTTADIRTEAQTTTVVLELPPADSSPIVARPTEPPPTASDEGARGTSTAGTGPAVGAGPAGRITDRPSTDEPAHPGRAPRATYGLITAAAGGGLVLTGLVFGGLARSSWQSAEDQCGGGHVCANADSINDGSVSEARTRATLSTVLVIGGAVALGIGTFLYFTAPRRSSSSASALRLTPAASPETVSLTLAGQF